MLGYLFLVYISGCFIEKWNQSTPWCYIMQGMGMVLGTVVCYLFGSLWLVYQSKLSFMAALTAGVLPFIPGDILKITAGIFVGSNIRKRLKKAGVL